MCRNPSRRSGGTSDGREEWTDLNDARAFLLALIEYGPVASTQVRTDPRRWPFIGDPSAMLNEQSESRPRRKGCAPVDVVKEVF
ncbi:MAG TPA: hypothetical protein VM120_19105 [Bryobacteraceae bacterium]|nr:hypothetical protein [Bryobacteraceae bacterium]